ncbi:hypothetical protein [Herbaspirillum sp. ST 5-3]|uniref:hypothetical protein n=1 Tax=Oxalobacteraceae TaxID=75682 RepID=UPI00200012A2|nr:hypothetical protein [Herbaspirillum sp. ST 5-3]
MRALDLTAISAGHAVAMLCGLISLCGVPASASAEGLQPLNDVALSSVTGRDGLSFDLSNFSLSGDARYTYYAPSPSTASAYIGSPYLSRSDDTASEFADPYRLAVVKGAPGMADVISLSNPLNANGLKRWQAAFDWGVNADGIAFEGGSAVFKDAVFYGGGMQWTTPQRGEGIAFGLALRADIGNILLRPRGRDDITQTEPASVAEQMNIRGVKIGAVDSNGNFLNTPWRIADVATQPGIFNAVTDAGGNPRLHVGIDWPDASGAALGGLQIDNVSFRSDITGNLDLGSSRIGSIQIQYLDIKVRP